MALTPGSYVPQGQVGTGAAYVHEIKDRSGYLDALAKAAEKQRLEQEKQIAKVKGFDYGVVTDPVMKKHIQEKYKEGLTTFAQIVAAGGDVNSVTTPEGIAFSAWTNEIKDEADTAKLAESKLSSLRTAYTANPDKYDTDLVQAAISEYNDATTPDAKLAASINLDPILIKNFDYNNWIQEEIDNAKTDKEITSLGEETVEYQNVFNKKLEQIPEILATKPGYKLAEKQWQKRKANGETGFQQDTFQDFLVEQVDAQKDIREFKTESPAAKDTNINIDVNTGTPTAGTTTEGSTANVGGLINSPNIGDDFNTGKAFLSTDDNGVETLVLKYNTGNYKDIGLNEQAGAYTDPQDPNAVVVPVKNLWTLKDTNFTTVSLQPESGKASEFKMATFYDEGGRSYTGVPSMVYKDQLGNLWLDLTIGGGKSASELHVPLRTGDYGKQKWGGKTDKDGNKIYENTKFNSAAEANQAAIATSMGLKGDDKKANFDLFINKFGPRLDAR